MRVSIDHSEKTTGLFSKTTHYLVTLKVEFSEEEKAIIKQRDLADTIIIERPQGTTHHRVEDYNYPIKISTLLKGPDEYGCRTPQEAKAYEAELTELLPKLKAFISQNAEVENKSTSFEL